MSTILLVEDNHLNRQLVTDLLEAAGHLVQSSTTAEDGLHMARSDRPDLILMDIRLPGMNGLEAIKHVREDPNLNDLTIVALTAQAMRGDDTEAVKAGFDGYITKPIDTRRFVDDVTRYLPHR
jgi:CheY-like chemotaxis protein